MSNFIFSDIARDAAKKSTNIVVEKFFGSFTRTSLENNFVNRSDDPTVLLHDVVAYARRLGGGAYTNDDLSFIVSNGKWSYMFTVCGMSGNGGVAAPGSDRRELIASLVAAINC